MPKKPELIAGLQVGAAASGECSGCHEVIVVQGDGGSPQPLGDLLREAFEEHLRSADLAKGNLSKKVMMASDNLD